MSVLFALAHPEPSPVPAAQWAANRYLFNKEVEEKVRPIILDHTSSLFNAGAYSGH